MLGAHPYPIETMPQFKPAYRALLIVNILTTLLALWRGWSISALLLPFWLQSMLLGVFHVRRMLVLQRFSTDGFASNGKPVPEDASGKRSTAIFFAFHYGFFHLFYLVFVLISGGGRGLTGFWLLLLALLLLIAQIQTHRDDVRRDAAGRPNLGSMMFMPYLRIVPMHLIIFIGSSQGDSVITLLSFMALKTLADLGMQAAEAGIERSGHRQE